VTSRACRVTERAQIVALELDSPTRFPFEPRDSGSIDLIGFIAPPLSAPTRLTRYVTLSLFRLTIQRSVISVHYAILQLSHYCRRYLKMSNMRFGCGKDLRTP
jgi:hypothetical protein